MTPLAAVVFSLISRLSSTVIALPTLIPTAAETTQFQSTALAYLSLDQAAEHLTAARIAQLITGERHETLLAIAWHETRFTPGYIQPEPPDPVTGGARASCGVMTPEPLPIPCRPASLVAQYVTGARHLALWRTTWGDRALDAYAGGNWLASSCISGPVVRNGRDLCQFARDMRVRAAWIVRPAA